MHAPQVSVLGLVPSSISIHDLDNRSEWTLSEFDDDTKLGGAVICEGHAAVQKDLNSLKKRVDRNLRQFNKEQYKVLYMGTNSPRHQYMLGITLLESTLWEKDLRILADTRLAVSRQSVLAAKRDNGILVCIRQSITNRSKEVILPVHSVLVSPHLQCWVQFWGPQSRRDTELLERVQRRATKMIKDLHVGGKAERTGTVQPGEEETQREPYQWL